MTRVNITHSETGDFAGWFDASRALSFEEDRRFDGRNMISCATGSQWNHEHLYYTASGNWVMHRWTQWQGGYDDYIPISQERAIAWLIVQCPRDGDIEKLPADVQAAIAAADEQAEM